MSARRLAAAAAVLLLAFAHTGQAQQQCVPASGFRSPNEVLPSAKYDGRYTFARIMYSESMGYGGGFGRREPFWHHDYPHADQHFSKLLEELTKIRAQTGYSVIVRLNDPELFKFPLAYLVEAGHWMPGEDEVLGFRSYLLKGGFAIFDDLSDRTGDMGNLVQQMQRVIPGMRLIELTPDHPIFDAFYRVKELEYYHPYYCYKSVFYGIFLDNDPRKRMLAIVNYNNDVGEYWEWSDMGFFGIDRSNEAYKLGINYIIYALTR